MRLDTKVISFNPSRLCNAQGHRSAWGVSDGEIKGSRWPLEEIGSVGKGKVMH